MYAQEDVRQQNFVLANSLFDPADALSTLSYPWEADLYGLTPNSEYLLSWLPPCWPVGW